MQRVTGRRYPGVALRGLGGLYLLAPGLIVMISLIGGRGNSVRVLPLVGPALATLAYPIILGFGLGWLAHARTRDAARRDDDRVSLVVLAVLFPLPAVSDAAYLWYNAGNGPP